MTDKMTDKNIINHSEYCVNGGGVLHMYTALWCGPCKRIKPEVLKIISKNEYKLIKDEEIQKSVFKENVSQLIPFFRVFKNDVLKDEIQTSDINVLEPFLIKNGVNIHVPLEFDDTF